MRHCCHEIMVIVIIGLQLAHIQYMDRISLNHISLNVLHLHTGYMHQISSSTICIFEVKLTFEILTVLGQQHSFSTHERIYLWKCQRFWDRKCLDLSGTIQCYGIYKLHNTILISLDVIVVYTLAVMIDHGVFVWMVHFLTQMLIQIKVNDIYKALPNIKVHLLTQQSHWHIMK